MVVIALLPTLHMRNCSLEKFRNLLMVMQLLKARIRVTVSLTGVSVFGCNSSFYKQNSFFLTLSCLKARDCLHWFNCSILFYLLFHCAQQVGFLFSCFYSSWLQDAGPGIKYSGMEEVGSGIASQTMSPEHPWLQVKQRQ